MTAGRDGSVYLGLTRMTGAAGTEWEVKRLDADGSTVTLLRLPAGHPAAVATPRVSFAVDARGTIYAADRANFRLAVFSSAGKLLRTMPADTWYHRLARRLLRVRPAAASRL